jgi:hypothetical protein
MTNHFAGMQRTQADGFGRNRMADRRDLAALVVVLAVGDLAIGCDRAFDLAFIVVYRLAGGEHRSAGRDDGTGRAVTP